MALKEDRPLLRSLSEASTSCIWFACSAGALVVSWCVLDSWSHDTVSGIFQINAMKGQRTNPFTGERVPDLQPFKYTLMLAFLQFAFLGLAFSALFIFSTAATGKSIADALERLRPTVLDSRWPALIGTHMFGSFLVQSLMMPTQMMSLGIFAATRAVEVPVVAGVRAKVFGARFGGHDPFAIGAMFCAAWLMFYSYSQIAECLCVWSGFGVALYGLPLYFVYALLLVLPACNLVLQESALTHLQMNPFLLQAVQNLFAAVLFLPILIGAHCVGYEDMWQAMAMVTGYREVYMAVIWLCIQTAIISAITVATISMTDSFWTVSAHSLRVVFWWVRQLPQFYLASGTLLSVTRPHASLWSFIMVGGIALGLSAVAMDRQHSQEILQEKHARSSSECSFLPKGLGTGRYV